MKLNIILVAILSYSYIFPCCLHSQAIPKEELIFLTSDWEGERFPDGRPKIPDDLLKRVENVGIEELWQILFNEGYTFQFERNWKMIHEDGKIIGRAVTALYMPIRPDIEKNILARGKKEGRMGRHLHWPINMLTKGDVYVADNNGRVGSLMGDNLGNEIYKRSGNGVVFDGFARDINGLLEIEGFNALVRDFSPEFLSGVLLMGLNTPICIGKAIVLPGDLVVADRTGVVFIPAHMAERVIGTAEFIELRDVFSHEMIKNARYNGGQLDAQWTNEIKEYFLEWLKSQPNEKEMSRSQLDKFLEKRTY